MCSVFGKGKEKKKQSLLIPKSAIDITDWGNKEKSRAMLV